VRHPHISHTNYSFHTRTTPLVLQEGPNGVYGLCNAVMLSGVWRGGGGGWWGQGGGGGKRASEQERKKGQERARKSVKRHERVRKKERKLKQRLYYDVFLCVHVCVCVCMCDTQRVCVRERASGIRDKLRHTCTMQILPVCISYVTHVHLYICRMCYGVATISRLLKIIGLFFRISSLL